MSVEEAQQRILSIFQPVEIETIPVTQSAGRILAEDICAPGDLPPFDNSSMDGFAVRSADVESAAQDSPVLLNIVADIPAGSISEVVIQPGQAARIMTGAPLPDGADAVIPVEDTDFSPALAADLPVYPPSSQVSIYQKTRPGTYIRPRRAGCAPGAGLIDKKSEDPTPGCGNSGVYRPGVRPGLSPAANRALLLRR